MKQNERFYLYCALNSVLSTKREIHKFAELCSKRTKSEARKISGFVHLMMDGIHRSQYVLCKVGFPMSWQAKLRARNGQWLLLQPRHEMSL